MEPVPNKREPEASVPDNTTFRVPHPSVAALGLSPDDSPNHHLSSSSPLPFVTLHASNPYAVSSIIRFHSSDHAESFENFDFDSTSSSKAAARTPRPFHYSNASVTDESSVQTASVAAHSTHEEQPIPHCSGITSVSRMTNDEGTTLIRQPQPSPQTSEQYNLQPLYSSEPMQTEAPAMRVSIANSNHPSTPFHRQSMILSTAARNYQIFPGRNKFFCGGRFMTSREYWAFLVALVLLVGPCVLFCIFTCPFLWYRIHPAVPVLFAYIFVLSLASMLKTSWTDPGIIPRDLDPSPALETFDDQASAGYGASIWSHPIPVQKEVSIKGSTWSLRYCETCRIYRPPRASHCRQCDNCVDHEDHHCLWLNNCIGKRNYRSFFVFIATATILCLYVIAFSLVHLLLIVRDFNGKVTFDTVFRMAPVSFVLAIVCFLLLWMVGGLTLYHCSLISKGVTTHEQLRASVMNMRHPILGANPYNKGNALLNMAHVLCRPQPKSYLRRRKYVDPELTKNNDAQQQE